ncbi:ABC transporter ATP-binding protein [Prosthecodimorpha staleyi]|uniref:ABC transporter ATP-binding protein n=1 Tax=Prosthecodimorpha staleyi TaxID=2840188 RepID=A0A947D4E3_9HYPH|nr:ABC transporter ATP-binding protein [Prosthecodimorpha staleyi]MBT9290123.1 ABC transporter ATP-binding protein [Prosthecodimorpha staleyi]
MATHGRDVHLKAVSVTFDTFTAVAPNHLEVKAGEFFSILGPSGCGKTTLLRVISGFLSPTAGRVLIGGTDMTDLGPNERPTALIFQNLALFPLMTVAENVAFGLEARGVGRKERRRRADELLDLVALSGMGDRMPGQLSGGQRQRVAVARALAVEPAVLLLDEPLSALDLKLRQHMRAELKTIQRRTGVTFIYITHDQSEALAMSDRIAVMNAGRIEQVDTPDRLYALPATPFVAGFVGEQNSYRGRVAETADGYAAVDTPIGRIRGRAAQPVSVGAAAIAMVRPERVGLVGDRETANRFEAHLTNRVLEGPVVTHEFAMDGGTMVAQAPNLGIRSHWLASVHAIGFDADDAVVFPAEASDA